MVYHKTAASVMTFSVYKYYFNKGLKHLISLIHIDIVGISET